MIDKIMTWVFGKLLQWLLKTLTEMAEKKLADAKLAKERDLANEKNVKEYEEAQTRADRVRAAADLLSGNP